MNLKFKLFFIALIFFAFAKQAMAQKAPDTLIIAVKGGKIILISDSLNKFNTIQTDVLIRKALVSIKDSLTTQERLAQQKAKRDSMYSKLIKNRFPLRFLPVLGLGLVRDKMSPFLGLSIDFAPQRQDYYYKKGGMYTFINVAANSYFTFKENAGKYKTQNNIFIEATIGNRINNRLAYKAFSEISAGIGYLIHQEGNYFTNNTFKIFGNIGISNSFIKIRPELYLSGNFSSIFPGIGIKLF
ncbi:MAG: hypothetical protein V4541_04325 [Bacteroidota bacterium]